MEQKLTFEDALFALGLSRDLINEKTKEMQKLRKRIDAMQRKLDRYKKYARIKHRKENKQAEERQKTSQCLFAKTVPLTMRFLKPWKVGETK